MLCLSAAIYQHRSSLNVCLMTAELHRILVFLKQFWESVGMSIGDSLSQSNVFSHNEAIITPIQEEYDFVYCSDPAGSLINYYRSWSAWQVRKTSLPGVEKAFSKVEISRMTPALREPCQPFTVVQPLGQTEAFWRVLLHHIGSMSDLTGLVSLSPPTKT